ncbi:hypothetical protein ACTNBM_07675 [Lachnospiraceae bacterium HCP1S3_C3]
MLNESVIKLLWKADCWRFFLETTLNNIKANDVKIAISVYDAQNLEGYQIKGNADIHSLCLEH